MATYETSSHDLFLLERARKVLGSRSHLFWIVGGACSGKTTISLYLSKEKNIPVYDMDAHIFGAFMPRYSLTRHPASRQWFGQPNPLEWALSLTWEEFDALNAATNVEYLDLFAEDIKEMDPAQTLIVDGGIAHPALLVQVQSPSQVICLVRNPAESRRAWEMDENRADMKRSILALPDGVAAWSKFLHFDRCITETLIGECRQNGIRIVQLGTASVSQMADLVSAHFNL